MKNSDDLKKEWANRVPKYSKKHKDLFDSLSQKYGAEGDRKASLGKHFSNNYELYMYAFFLGLYKEEFELISEEEDKDDFSYAIHLWGRKSTRLDREDFTDLQDYMFMASFVKSDFDFIELEKGNLSIGKAVRSIISATEGYANGGLQLIKEMLEEDANAFLAPTALMTIITEPSTGNEFESSVEQGSEPSEGLL